MIDLTPLDVRKKKGDFRRGLRGYEPPQVDEFLDLVAERLEDLVRENTMLRERTAQLAEALNAFRAREQAMNEALVSAQQLREEIREQSARQADLNLREARAEGERLLTEARRDVEQEREALRRVEGQRARFLRSFRTFLEGQLEDLLLEEERARHSAGGEGEAGGDDPLAVAEGADD
jgi:DivIVA domain-containing protein